VSPSHSSPAVDLSVALAGLSLSNPVIAASGTFGYGTEYSRVIDVSRLGGICSKGLTLEPKPGNAGWRVLETPAGLMNSIGLENPGIPHFIEHELATMRALGPAVIANLSGSTIESYVEGARLLDASDVDMIELNISCPNVKAGGMAWGLECDAAATVTRAVRDVTGKPLMVKLSPNAPRLVDVAKAVVGSGADALSLVNTFQAFAVDIERARPFFENVTAGLAGPAIKPIALRMVRDVALGVPECDARALRQAAARFLRADRRSWRDINVAGRLRVYHGGRHGHPGRNGDLRQSPRDGGDHRRARFLHGAEGLSFRSRDARYCAFVTGLERNSANRRSGFS
jgi:dihydroorotate dehydrogenase (NAD+) catalytic subunit